MGRFFIGRDLNPLSSPSGFAAQRRERVGTSCTKCRQALQIPPSPPRRSKLYIACSDFYFKNRSALMPLLLLSKSNPLRWALIWFIFFHGRDLNPCHPRAVSPRSGGSEWGHRARSAVRHFKSLLLRHSENPVTLVAGFLFCILHSSVFNIHCSFRRQVFLNALHP